MRSLKVYQYGLLRLALSLALELDMIKSNYHKYKKIIAVACRGS